MPEVVIVRPADYEKIAAFLASFPGERKNAEFWLARLRSWWDRNPSFTEDFERGWTLMEGSEMVGFLGAVPLKFLQGGAEKISVAGTTWRVLPKFRGMSMALVSRKMAAHPQALHFAGNAARQVPPVLKLLRFQPLDKWRGGEMQSIVIVNMGKYMRDKLKPRMLRALAPVLALAARLVQSFMLRRLWRCNPANVRDLSKADGAFDDLWARTRQLYPNTNVRTAAMVQWFCFENMPVEKKLLGYFRGDRLLGYMTLWIEEDSGMRVAYCVDLWFDPSENEIEIVGALVSQAAKWAAREGLDRAIFPHFHPKTAEVYASLALPRHAAWKRREFIFGPGEVLGSMTPENTYLVGAQGEVGL